MQRVCKLIHISRNWSGENIGVGVLDSGVFIHDDLKGRIVGFKDFTSARKISPYDDSGHGTHVCGIIAGNGVCSNGIYSGIAPKCNLWVGKILDKYGDGEMTSLFQGIKWLMSVAQNENIRVINISVSSVSLKSEREKELLYALFEQAFKSGIIIVTSAGNTGPSGRSVSRLGDSPYVICVGCHEGRDSSFFYKKCQDYSGRGPGNIVYRKPDIVAPGTEIISCGIKNRTYTQKSGTSMATPLVSGALALAFQKYPDFSAAEIKRKLLFSADDLGENFLLQGFGMLNIKKMLGESEGKLW